MGESVLLNVYVTDGDSSAVKISGTDLPAFASFLDYRDNSARITVNSAETDAGVHTATLDSEDESGNTDTVSFTLKVAGAWRGLPVDSNGLVDTGGSIGWLYVSQDPGVYSYSLEK